MSTRRRAARLRGRKFTEAQDRARLAEWDRITAGWDTLPTERVWLSGDELDDEYDERAEDDAEAAA